VSRKVVLYFPKVGVPEKWFKMPLSVMTLATALEEHDYDPVIIDGHLSSLDVLRQQCDGALAVGISTMTGFQINHALAAARVVRETNQAIPIIWGGWHPSILPEETLAHPLVDAVVIGRGEEALVKALEQLRFRHSLADRVFTEPVHGFTRPAYHLVNMLDYVGPDLGTRTLSYCSSVGCPNRCGFCAIGGGWVGEHVNHLLDNINELVFKYQLNAVRFDDGNFFGSSSRAVKFALGLINRKIHIQWSAFARADTIASWTPEFAKLMVKSGLTELAVGAESGSNRVLAEIVHKQATVDELQQAVKICHEFGIQVLLSWIVGFPGETSKERSDTYRLIGQYRKERIEQMLYFYTPWPGTDLWSKAITMGLQYPNDLASWGGWRLEDQHLPWLSDWAVDQIKEYAAELRLERFYIRANRIGSQLGGATGKLIRWDTKLRLRSGIYNLPVEYWTYLALQGHGKSLSKMIAKRG